MSLKQTNKHHHVPNLSASTCSARTPQPTHKHREPPSLSRYTNLEYQRLLAKLSLFFVFYRVYRHRVCYHRN